MPIAELERINALARKARHTALTADELSERDVLRRAYVRQITGQVNNMLTTLTVVDQEGSDVTPAKLRAAQRRGMMQMI